MLYDRVLGLEVYFDETVVVSRSGFVIAATRDEEELVSLLGEFPNGDVDISVEADGIFAVGDRLGVGGL